MKEKVSVTGVPETMIQTLYARAKESEKDNPMIQMIWQQRLCQSWITIFLMRIKIRR